MFQVKSLLEDNQTLFGFEPSKISTLVRDKLLSLEQQNLEVVDITALPDHHSFSQDGGVKDIVFLCKPVTLLKRLPWQTSQVLEDNKSFYGVQTDKILVSLQNKLDELVSDGRMVKHLIMLTDHHNFAFASGTGGYDGLKNVIICYY